MIVAENLAIAAGTFRISGINFSIPAGAYCALMGRTGSGKTTLLETICGLKPAAGGTIALDGRNAATMRPADRGIGLVPQDAALFSTMTVHDHLAFALKIRKAPPANVAARVKELANLLEIAALLGRRPHGLSIGEKHRVALGRALAHYPKILCLDEPLAALDDETREHLIEMLGRVHREHGVTTIHITHNRSEADALADCRLIIRDGKIVCEQDAATDQPR